MSLNKQKVGEEKPPLLKMITDPGVQFEWEKIWDMFFLLALLQVLFGSCSA